MRDNYNYTTYCEHCAKINIIIIPIKYNLKPIDFLELTEIKCLYCKKRILI